MINYADLLRTNPNAYPRAFWINTSGNDIIRKFIGQAGAATRMELERLISGETVTKKINQELTYRDLYQSIDNLWSVLFTTGYLTQRENSGTDRCQQPDIYQYGFFYDPQNGHSPTTTNCGMFYIIRLADQRLVMIDGGHYLQCSKEAVEGMYRFLRRITGTKEGETIRIAAWIFSHAHDDHMAACVRLLRTYPEMFALERVMFHFPSYAVRNGDDDIIVLKETLREFCPEARCLKLHNGQAVTLANVRFEVMFTHEDAVASECPAAFPFGDFNCTSLILKMTTGSGTVMWLGDTNAETETLVVRTVPAKLWKSDVVQIAHHCFNFLPGLYRLIDADYAMLPNSHYGGNEGDNHRKLADVVKLLASPENVWYEDQTTGFRFENGTYRVILEEPCVGGEHDGTDLYGR